MDQGCKPNIKKKISFSFYGHKGALFLVKVTNNIKRKTTDPGIRVLVYFVLKINDFFIEMRKLYQILRKYQI